MEKRHKYKKILASLMALCMVNTMMLYTPQGSLLDQISVFASDTGNTGGSSATGGSYSTGWVTDGNVLGYRVFPVRFGALLSDDSEEAQTAYTEFQDASIYINVANGSDIKSTYNLWMNNNQPYFEVTDIENRKVSIGTFDGFTEGTFQYFIYNSLNGLTLSNNNVGDKATGVYNECLAYNKQQGQPDMMFTTYMEFLSAYIGTDTDIYKNIETLYNTECSSTHVNNNREFMLIVEPLTEIHNKNSSTTAPRGYISLMEGLEVLNSIGNGVATAMPKNVFTNEKISYLEKYAGINGSWATQRVASYTSDYTDIPGANASKYLYPFRNIKPTLIEDSPNLDQDIKDTINGTSTTTARYCGFMWFSLNKDGAMHKDSVYDVVETVSVVDDEAAKNDFLTTTTVPNLTFNGKPIVLEDALTYGLIDNDTIVQNYYRRTTDTSDEHYNDILTALDLSNISAKDKDAYHMVQLTGAEASKTDRNSPNFYFSVSPYQNVKYLLPPNDYFNNHQDYNLGGTGNTDTLTTVGKLNYSELNTITSAEDLTGINTIFNLTSEEDSNYDYLELTNVQLIVNKRDFDSEEYSTDKASNITRLCYTVKDTQEFLNLFKDNTSINLQNLSTEIVDSEGNITTLAELLSNKLPRLKGYAYTIEVKYEYTRVKEGETPPPPTNSYDADGYFATTIPSYALNTYYSKLENTENLESYISYNNDDKANQGTVPAKIYANYLYSDTLPSDVISQSIVAKLGGGIKQSTVPTIEYTTNSTISGDDNTYIQTSILAQSVPIISTYSTGIMYQEDYNGVLKHSPVIEDYAHYDTKLTAQKNAKEYKIELATWVSDANDDIYLNSFKNSTNYIGKTASNSRTVGGIYLLSESIIPINYEETILKYVEVESNAEDVENVENEVSEKVIETETHSYTTNATVMPSKYGTDCKIYNYNAMNITDTYTSTDTIISMDLTGNGTGTTSSNLLVGKRFGTGVGKWNIIP